MVFCSCLMENETVQHRMDSTFPRPGVGAYMFWAVFQKGKKIMKMENLVVVRGGLSSTVEQRQ